MTVEEVSQALGLSKSLVYKLTSTGKLPHHGFGRSVRIARDALDACIRKARKAD